MKLPIIVFIILFIRCWTFKLSSSTIRHPKTLTKMVIDPLLSLGCGSIAGVVGIGVAYPFDSLKTKAQVYAISQEENFDKELNSKGKSLLNIARIVYNKEGIRGFYQGVAGVMVGEAFVKATLFGANSWALSLLCPDDVIPSIWELTVAAAFSGVVSSFVLNPIERVKVLMQANQSYTSELDCIRQVVQKDGVTGLMVRGLSGMLAREIPGCIVYFLLYTLLRTSSLPEYVGTGPASFLSGAAAGVGAWIPIYPADVVKTEMQNTQGQTNTLTNDGQRIDTGTSNGEGFWASATELFRKFGPSVFFVGIQPKLLRAGVNHAVTFSTYNQLLQMLDSGSS